MGFINSLFGGGQKDNEKGGGKEEVWIPLKDAEQLHTLVRESFNRLQVLFKHSTSCGISAVVWRHFRAGNTVAAGEADYYILDIRAQRQLSDEIAYRWKVAHESPQLLLLRDGELVFHTSHGAIASASLQRYL